MFKYIMFQKIFKYYIKLCDIIIVSLQDVLEDR